MQKPRSTPHLTASNFINPPPPLPHYCAGRYSPASSHHNLPQQQTTHDRKQDPNKQQMNKTPRKSRKAIPRQHAGAVRYSSTVEPVFHCLPPICVCVCVSL
ncbi:hypothetical protein BDP81DRAFT_426371 [Colletotrichum phormii]|uniref:Uncharacterized protein n=1 Tax=Colletotrichum phormii TaxID=359342 RepID=A0AAI9ZUN3_9PEZI|nr:uncharacterized protein BDP81DRAFT_426371 [Colletotrichum phormii]KAK1636977.1 hypothetical protein BDP81DRAFT_426371 [Colletotrichum phormii]